MNRAFLKNKDIVFWGTGAVAYNIVKYDKSLNVSFLVDNDPAFHKKGFSGLKVYPPSILKKQKDKVFVIVSAISSKSQKSIYEELWSMGFKMGAGFVDYADWCFESVKIRLATKAGFSCDINLLRKAQAMIWASEIDSQATRTGAWVFLECLRKTRKVPGDIADMGTYLGGTAWLGAVELLNMKNGRTFHLMDSFEGHGSLDSQYDPKIPGDAFAIDNFRKLEDFFSLFPNIRIHKGFFSDTLPDIQNNKFSFVYISCGLYEPNKECMQFFWPRMESGGLILVQDYFERPGGYTGVKRGVDEFVAENKLTHSAEIIEIPESTQILVSRKYNK
ncbi:MAG: hypothetical protein JXA17_08940 [Dehalococcoidales bacterium]|nr:hypothetical protein [Dehalococcoidales bacterium]